MLALDLYSAVLEAGLQWGSPKFDSLLFKRHSNPPLPDFKALLRWGTHLGSPQCPMLGHEGKGLHPIPARNECCPQSPLPAKTGQHIHPVARYCFPANKSFPSKFAVSQKEILSLSCWGSACLLHLMLSFPNHPMLFNHIKYCAEAN